MKFGLREEDLQCIKEKIGQFCEIEKAVIFGSRAMNTYRNGSDVDIAIFGTEVDFSTVAKLKSLLEELSPMPYLFDIVDAAHLTHQELSDHIRRVGIVIYPD